MSNASVIRLKPFFYIHVLDNNTNVTRIETGPQTFTRQEHEKVLSGPDEMINISPRHYAIIQNPVSFDEEGNVLRDNHGQYKLRHGDEEIRFEQDPFPLYPGEKLFAKVSPLQVVAPNAALRLCCIRDFESDGEKRSAGDEWLFKGPGTYIPRVEVQVKEITRAVIIVPNRALKLRARKETVDGAGVKRKAGEEWLVRQEGAYLPGVDEEYIDTVNAIVLTEKKALHLRAKKTYTDIFGVERKAGAEWLVTSRDAEAYIADVYETVVGEVKITTLNNRQFCVVLDPYEDGKLLFGQKKLVKGEASFFLRPGERLESGIQSVHILGEEEALLLRAKEEYTDEKEKHEPGDRWMVFGPTDYIPPTQVEIVEKRRKIPLDENEGIYVRDIKSGKVRAVTGESYMLQPHEELWEKELPSAVETLLAKERKTSEDRDRTRVVSYRAPHNSAVQIYDYKEKKARVVFGPDLVLLGPEEHFTVLSLSGDKPKKPHQIKSIALLLGPDFMTDIVIVETSDHARLSLKLSYNWHFEVDRSSKDDTAKIFQVPDFVGDSCKAIASRVRGSVASVTFDSFHKNSSEIIKTAVFGIDPETEEPRTRFFFSSNNLVITNIDVQSVEPVDQRTRDALQKSVQLAIEITTSSQEATARHNAERIEQEARGRLRRQEIKDKAAAENAHIELLILQSQSAAVQATGQATAEAKALAEASAIEGRAAVKHAELHAESLRIKAKADLEDLVARNAAEIDHTKQLNELFLNKETELARIEQEKFSRVVTALGRETIKKIAQAGPEMQAKLLGGLGLESVMITDGSSPINLFSTAQGLVAQGN